ncbi:MAG TPA: 6-phosphogluconolactonase [Micropepsaceae bacterium]|nr:6-phosphogluconolactonase [Micropepsaceae bacterium]
MKIEIAQNDDELARQAAEWMLQEARKSRGVFAVSLAGGETPRRLYTLLATAPYSESFPFERAHWFFGDERFVPPDDPMSNYRMARETLFARVRVKRENLHPIPTENMTPEQSASRYEQELRKFYGSDELDPERPLFAIELLGLGKDGHTASLFPGNPALRQRDSWVVAVDATHGARITLTYPALDSASSVAFLVSGFNKRAALRRLIRGDQSIPAARVRPSGEVFLFADTHAMATD